MSTPNTVEANRAVVAQQCGRTVLWVGVETRGWQLADWRACGQFAHSLGVDSICAKVADGGVKWYGGPEQLAAIRDTVHTTGCGFIPFSYLYGPRFAMPKQAQDECAILAELLSVCPIAQADMEAEFNNQPAAAQLYEQLLRPVKGLLSVSTWADPIQQAWEGVAHDLAPAVNQWVIQQYTNWLAAQEGQYDPAVFTCIAPGVDLRPEFGADNALAIVEAAIQHGHQTVYIWEYESARANPDLVKQITQAMRAVRGPETAGSAAPVPPAPSASPAPTTTDYHVVAGDTLSAIATRFHTTIAAIMALNPIITNPDFIEAGWDLKLP